MIRRLVVVIVMTLGLGVGAIPPGKATTSPLTKWRDCGYQASGLQVHSTFFVSTATYGTGRYYIRTDIRWDLNKSGHWRREDNRKAESIKYQVNRPQNIAFNSGDRTVWGAAYYGQWRAHVIVKLLKVRRGPDKKIEQDDRYYSRALFPERSDPETCGTGF